MKKKETLEEVAERFVNITRLRNPKSLFIEGAQWQQEQNKIMYSDLIDLLERLRTIYIEDCDLDIIYDKKRIDFIELLKNIIK